MATSRQLGKTGDEASDEETKLAGYDLVIGYSDEPVIDGETVEFPAGEVSALVGPNGSGKSTVLKGLSNQLAPDDGEVLLDGTDIHSLETKELARRLGLLSQENVAPDSITAEELIYHGRYPHRGFFETVSDEDVEAVERAVELAGVEHLRDREISSLSGGQKQLVWIAMVLAQDTDVLLLDEPTTFLDLNHQLKVMNIVEKLRDEDVTVVVVLHDINQAARFSDNVVVLKDGEIHSAGEPADVLTEDVVSEVFEIEATVENGGSHPTIIPHSPR